MLLHFKYHILFHFLITVYNYILQFKKSLLTPDSFFDWCHFNWCHLNMGLGTLAEPTHISRVNPWIISKRNKKTHTRLIFTAFTTHLTRLYHTPYLAHNVFITLYQIQISLQKINTGIVLDAFCDQVYHRRHHRL